MNLTGYTECELQSTRGLVAGGRGFFKEEKDVVSDNRSFAA